MTNFGVYFYLAFAILVLFYFYIKRKFSYFTELGIPHTKPSFPFGNLKGLGSKFHSFDLALNVYKENKGKDFICGVYSFIQPVYVVIDPELAKSVLVKDFNSFVNRGGFVNEEDEPLTGHLFSIENEQWRFLRNKLSPVFTSGKLKAMYPIVINQGGNLVAAIERETSGGKSINTKNIINRFTCDIISSVAFGMEANTLNHENEILLTILNGIFGSHKRNLFKYFFMISFPQAAKKLGFKMYSKSLSDFFTKTVVANIKYREDTNDNRKDFLNMLIQLKNKGSIDGEFSTDVKKLTLNEIMAQAFLFFFGGSETSSGTISFALAELSNNQEIQNKLRKEIEERTKETNGKITYEILHEMKYLDMVVNEILRMYPSNVLQTRVAFKDYHVPNTKYVIPKGSPVWINSLGFHYDEKYYPNPTKFDPERFTQEEINKRPSFTWLPFGEGPRNCIGMRFGLILVKLAISYIIKNFKVTPSPEMEFPLKINPSELTLQSKCGFRLKFEKV